MDDIKFGKEIMNLSSIVISFMVGLFLMLSTVSSAQRILLNYHKEIIAVAGTDWAKFISSIFVNTNFDIVVEGLLSKKERKSVCFAILDMLGVDRAPDPSSTVEINKCVVVGVDLLHVRLIDNSEKNASFHDAVALDDKKKRRELLVKLNESIEEEPYQQFLCSRKLCIPPELMNSCIGNLLNEVKNRDAGTRRVNI